MPVIGGADLPWAEDASTWDAADEEEVRAQAAEELEAALSWSEARDDEAKDMLDRYRGEPYGTEQEGFSQYVDRSVLDTVEWILPGLLEIFHGTDETGQFEPVGEEDVAGAEQATDYVNYVYTRDNPGFLLSHTVIKDALIERLGVWKSWWDETATVSVSSHTGLSEIEALALVEDPEVTVLAIRQRLDPALLRQAAQSPMGADPAAAMVYDVKVKRTKRAGRIAVEAVPREEYVYNADARRPDQVRFHAHVRTEAATDLIAMGFDPDVIEGLPADTEVDLRRTRRWDPETGWVAASLNAPTHESMRRVEVAECYIRADFDGDGVAEWRCVWLGGPGKELLKQEIIDEPPFDPMTPVLMGHQLEGLSVAELVADLQALRTDIMRQMLDGLFETNSPTRKILMTADKATADAVMNWQPGRPIFVRTMDDVQWETPAWNGVQALPVLEYVDRIMQGRSGVSATSTGTNPDLLQNQTAAGLAQLMSAAQQKVNLIARVMAETGFKRLFNRLLRLAARYQDKPRMLRLRGTWTQMDPRSWNASMDFVPNVGLGTGDKAQKRQAVGEVLAAQKEVGLTYPNMVGPPQVYNALKELVKASGLPSVEPYFADPQTTQAPPPGPPDPMQDPMVAATMAAENIKAQASMEKLRLDDDFRRDKLRVDTLMAAMEASGTVDMTVVLGMLDEVRSPSVPAAQPDMAAPLPQAPLAQPPLPQPVPGADAMAGGPQA